MKILPVFLRYGCGIKSCDGSSEHNGFYSALKQATDEVYPFWYDEYLGIREAKLNYIIKIIDEFLEKERTT